MPTKKKRVGFIPRSDVLDTINQLSDESNLSISKVINILVEEALYKRGFLKKDNLDNKRNSNNFLFNKIEGNGENNKQSFVHDLQDKLLDNDNNYDRFDLDVYEKFLMFLEFQNKIKNTNF